MTNQTAAVLDLSRLPGLQRYLASLSHDERVQATDRLAALSSADLLSLGVSEPQHTEHDYRVEEIEGTIPRAVRDAVPQRSRTLEDHTGRPLHHLFDGDGMLSAFTIRDGGLHYRNRYVRTRHYQGKTGTTHLGTAAPGGWRANIAKTPPNLANTNVVEHAGRLYALWEGGAPYEVDPDTLDTIGVRHFGGELRKGQRSPRIPASVPGPAICTTSVPNSSRDRTCASTAPIRKAPLSTCVRSGCRTWRCCTISRSRSAIWSLCCRRS